MPQPAPEKSPSSPETKSEKKAIAMDTTQLPTRDGLPVLWTDQTEFYLRQDIQTATLKFFAYVPPDSKVEVARLQTTIGHMRRMAENIITALAEEAARARGDTEAAEP